MKTIAARRSLLGLTALRIHLAVVLLVVGAAPACNAAVPASAPPLATPTRTAEASVAPPVSPCAEAERRVAEARREQAAGRLLRVLAIGAAPDPACPDASKQLAALCLSAAASLGDAAAAKRWRGEAPEPPLFAPDGPVDALSSPADARAAYLRAAEAYQAGRWADAARIALPVGAARGAFAGEAFVLAARSAEREGDPARAARMWARAYRVACAPPAACAVEPPRDNVFGINARYGNLVPWSLSHLCWSQNFGGSTTVNGTWEVVASGVGVDVREVPSRVLLDPVEAPETTCFSRDGRHRISIFHPVTPVRESVVGGALRSPSTTPSLPLRFHPSTLATYVLDDGVALFAEGRGFWWVDTKTRGVRLVPSRGVSSGLGVGEPGFFYASETTSTAPKEWSARVVRYDLATGKSTTAYGGLPSWPSVGPVDEKGRFLVHDDERLRWVDGTSGKVLAEMAVPAEMHQSPRPTHVGVLPPSTLVWVSYKSDEVHVTNPVTGASETGGLVFHPAGADGKGDADAVAAVVAEVLARASPPGRSPAPSFRVNDARAFQDAVVPIEVSGKTGELRVVIGADRKGALVIAPDGRFEILGQVHPAFRSAAACGDGRTRYRSGDRAWPLEVCAAALEQPGIAAEWLAAP